MKKKASIVLVTICVMVVIIGIAFSAFGFTEVNRKKRASIMWNCSVTCMEASTSEEYVINYADSKVISKTGTLTIQNRNDFDIVVHLQCEGESEMVSDNIPSGGCYSFLQTTADKEYTVGIHAAVDANTEIKVFVYDGKDTELYTKQPSTPPINDGEIISTVEGTELPSEDAVIPKEAINFNAEVKEISENGELLVTHVSTAEGFTMSDGDYYVSAENLMEDVQLGDTVTIWFNGMIQETYPARLGVVYRIVKAE